MKCQNPLCKKIFKQNVNHTGTPKRFCSRTCMNRRAVIRFRQNLKKRAVEYKGGKCEKCGYNKYIEALCFHHKDPDKKDFSIGSGDCKAWDKVKIELDKCYLVCSNCHHEIHAEIQKSLYDD